ncbi:transposase [Micromonospora sp. NPDC051925]|uniref:transposase n=1 Tax=Micromonospora sp. NPDC051925 TaxID=3364288 RepID=UPI0037C83BDF
MERHEFGAAVRQLRESTAPAAVGLPIGRRRVRGLRREELGELAGMSADYVRRLEQGRSHPSAGVVNAIARALRIERAEYERLCALAGYAAADGQVPSEVGPGAMRLLERFTDTPMFVSDAAMNLVAVNSAFMALGHWELTGDPWEWNVAWRTFCDPFHGFKQSADDATDHEAILAARLRNALHRHDEFLRFLRTIDTTVPRNLQIHMIVDNYGTHTHPNVKAWLAKHPRFHLHFTPTSSSWLNMVERWFAALTDKMIRRGVFHSVDDLITAIEEYLRVHNDDPKPFVWTATAESILAKVRRGRVALQQTATQN